MENNITRWRAERFWCYFRVTSYGEIVNAVDYYHYNDDHRYSIGNYFKTEEEAKNSKIYKAFHEKED
jgi:hypothetical protein